MFYRAKWTLKPAFLCQIFAQNRRKNWSGCFGKKDMSKTVKKMVVIAVFLSSFLFLCTHTEEARNADFLLRWRVIINYIGQLQEEQWARNLLEFIKLQGTGLWKNPKYDSRPLSLLQFSTSFVHPLLLLLLLHTYACLRFPHERGNIKFRQNDSIALATAS